jgi:hypothetical protein
MHKEVQMFKTVSELQEFILWAKKERVESFKAGDVEVSLSAYAFIDAISELSPEPQSHKTEERNTSKTLVDTLNTTEDDEELLFFSAKS